MTTTNMTELKTRLVREFDDLLFSLFVPPLVRGQLPERERPENVSGVNVYPQQLGRVLAAKYNDRINGKA